MIFVSLATLQFGKNHGHVVLLGERLTMLAERAAAHLETAATIGLPLSTVHTADALLPEITVKGCRAVMVDEPGR